MGDLSKIPQAFPEILLGSFTRLILSEARDFIIDDVPQIAADYEVKYNDELKNVAVGKPIGPFMVTRRNTVTGTVTLEARIADKSVPGVPGLKLGLGRVEIEMEPWINITRLDQPKFKLLSPLTSYAIEVAFARENYSVRLGYAQDNSPDHGSHMALVEILWDSPSFYLFGLWGESNVGGLLIDVRAVSPVAIPLGPTGMGLAGIELRYGEKFAPALLGATAQNVMAIMAKADAESYVKWATEPVNVTSWIAVPDDVRLYGIGAAVVDMVSGGGVVSVRQAGIAYISYGPTIIFGGGLVVLKTLEVDRVLGAIDVRSKSLFVRATKHVPVFPDDPGALALEGSIELSASLTDQNRTYVALGGYEMDGCSVSLLDLCLLKGGARFVPLQGAAARGYGRLEAKGTVGGFGGGFSFWVDARGEIGWNPIVLGGHLELGGNVWVSAFGKRLGIGVTGITELVLKQPLLLKLTVTFTIEIPFFSDIVFDVPVLDLETRIPPDPLPALIAAAIDPLAFLHAPSGQTGKVTPTDYQVWPDVTFLLDFQRPVRERSNIVNPPNNIINPVNGLSHEGGVDVDHRFDALAIERKDPVTGSYTPVPDVRACWLLNANGAPTEQSNRLAIPCNDPLAWLNRFEYAQPGTIHPVRRQRFQTFGLGPDMTFVPPAGASARVTFEEVTVESPAQMRLAQQPWSEGYERELSGSSLSISFNSQIEGVSTPIPVDLCELRILGRPESPPRVNIVNGTAAAAAQVRLIAGEYAEWSIAVSRSKAESILPLIVPNDDQVRLIAIGYAVLQDIVGGQPDLSVLGTGFYRLKVIGNSKATFRGTDADHENDWSFIRTFEVVPPPLRPYLRYATLGDERIFGVNFGGWNPNPAGFGFGHYQGHLGQVRARVAYLSQIYPELWVSRQAEREGDTPIPVRVLDCDEGTLVGSKASQAWRRLASLPAQIEEELSFAIPADVGQHQIRILRKLADTGKLATVDEWSYRVSRFVSPVEHLTPGQAEISRSFGPFGSRSHQPSQPPVLPPTFNPDAIVDAKLATRRALPPQVSGLTDATDPQAGLSFLHLLEWCGVFDPDSGAPGDDVFARPESADICAILDRGRDPVGLLIRTCEPVDWRRVEITLVSDPAGAAPIRLGSRILPSPDGCSALVLALAQEVAVRLPKGPMAMRIRFRLCGKGHPLLEDLPTLTPVADPHRKLEDVLVAFDQPFGTRW